MTKIDSAEAVLRSEEVGAGISNDAISRLMRVHYEDAKQHKQNRADQIDWTNYFLREFQNAHDELTDFFNDKLEAKRGKARFVSGIAHTVIEKKCASDWVPEIHLEPEENVGGNTDVYFARNCDRVLQFQLTKGRFKREAQRGSTDLFGKGRLVIQIGTETRDDASDEIDEITGEPMLYTKGTLTKYKWRPWETVFWTSDDRVWMIVEEATLGELIEEFGEEVKNFKLYEGANAWLSKDRGEEIDLSEEASMLKKVQYMYYYNPDEKVYACAIGGSENFWGQPLTGENYPHIDAMGNGEAPFAYIDGSAYRLDGHPICDLDKIVPICQNYDVLFNSLVNKSKRATRAVDIVASANPKKARLEWLRDEANAKADLNIPRFVTLEEGQNVFAKTLETGVDANTPIALRNIFIDEITMVTGVNLQLQGKGAETARQEELRMRRELEVIDENIKINEGNYEDLATKSVNQLQNTDLDFHDTYISIEDEVSELNGVDGEGTVREIVENIKGFPFNVKVSVNQSNAKRMALEIAQQEAALTILAAAAPGSKGVAEMSYEIAKKKFPGLKASAEDFFPTQPVAGAEGAAAAPGLNPLTRP